MYVYLKFNNDNATWQERLGIYTYTQYDHYEILANSHFHGPKDISPGCLTPSVIWNTSENKKLVKSFHNNVNKDQHILYKDEQKLMALPCASVWVQTKKIHGLMPLCEDWEHNSKRSLLWNISWNDKKVIFLIKSDTTSSI